MTQKLLGREGQSQQAEEHFHARFKRSPTKSPEVSTFCGVRFGQAAGHHSVFLRTPKLGQFTVDSWVSVRKSADADQWLFFVVLTELAALCNLA